MHEMTQGHFLEVQALVRVIPLACQVITTNSYKSHTILSCDDILHVLFFKYSSVFASCRISIFCKLEASWLSSSSFPSLGLVLFLCTSQGVYLYTMIWVKDLKIWYKMSDKRAKEHAFYNYILVFKYFPVNQYDTNLSSTTIHNTLQKKLIQSDQCINLTWL